MRQTTEPVPGAESSMPGGEAGRETATLDAPTIREEGIRRLIRSELSTRARVGYVLFLLAAGAVVVGVGSLWGSEPDLPLRTQAAFGGIVGIGLVWIVFCLWVLTRRKVLYAHHRIVSARLAAVFCAVFIAGALVTGFATGEPFWGAAAAAFGAAQLALALALLRRAQRHREALLKQRRALEAQTRQSELAA